MKKLLLLLLLTAGIYAQQTDFIDSTVLVTGAGDTTYFKELQGLYSYVYLVVTDSGSTYTDSIKVYTGVKKGTDSVYAQITLRNVTAGVYADYGATSSAGTVSKYLILDAYIDRLRFVWSNATFVTGKQCKIYIMGVKR